MSTEVTFFNGLRWVKYSHAKSICYRMYFHRSFKVSGVKFKVFLHRYVWEKAFGAIPEGLHVHHVDGDPSNNALENLTLVTPEKHVKLHREMGIVYGSFPLDEFPTKILIEKICPRCGVKFKTDNIARKYCSRSCMHKMSRTRYSKTEAGIQSGRKAARKCSARKRAMKKQEVLDHA